MPNRIFYLCFLLFIFISLCIAPMALALEKEKILPDYNAACPPASGGGNYAAAQSAGPSIQDVWMRHGGARLYYSAQYAPRQMYTGGASRIDPACLPLLPPMRAWGKPETRKKSIARRAAAKPAVPCPEAAKPTATSQGPAMGGASGKKTAQVEAGVKSSASLSRAEAIARAKAASEAEAARLARQAKNPVPPKAAPEKIVH